jgi:hypothetical protein
MEELTGQLNAKNIQKAFPRDDASRLVDFLS